MTDRHDPVDPDEAELAKECLEAEIEFRKGLIEKLEDPTPHDLKYVWRILRDHGTGDVHLEPGGDTWAQVRLKDWFRDQGYWDEDDRYPILDQDD